MQLAQSLRMSLASALALLDARHLMAVPKRPISSWQALWGIISQYVIYRNTFYTCSHILEVTAWQI